MVDSPNGINGNGPEAVPLFPERDETSGPHPSQGSAAENDLEHRQAARLATFFPGVEPEWFSLFEIGVTNGLVHPVVRHPDTLAEQFPDSPPDFMRQKSFAATQAHLAERTLSVSGSDLERIRQTTRLLQEGIRTLFNGLPVNIVRGLLRDPARTDTFIDSRGPNLVGTRYGLDFSTPLQADRMHVTITNPGNKLAREAFDKDPQVRSYAIRGVGTPSEQVRRRLDYAYNVMTPRRRSIH